MNIHGKEVSIWDGQYSRPTERQYSISLCTTCMGRAHDVAKTLPQNIIDNANYPSVEHVLLDYNSQDNFGHWVRDNLSAEIESGRVVYARTTEPRYYSMAHSRNVAFRVASGEIVCNVDADNWTTPGFAEALNKLANQQAERALFAKGRQLLRGRIGFYKHEWEHLLGGYDEELANYGFDDLDLVHRAYLQGFKLMYFGGKYVARIKTGSSDKVLNMEVKNWRTTEAVNKEISASKIQRGILKANEGRPWGAAKLIRNFKEAVNV